MKIAFINIYQDCIERGAEVFVSELSRKLQVNHEVAIFSSAQKPLPRWKLLWRFYLDPFGFQTFFSTLKYLPSILKSRFDIVIPVNGGWQPALIRIITWLYGGKMVISGQSGIGWDDRNNLWCFPDCFVALTNYTADWAKRVNPFVKVEVIPNGVDIERFSKEKSKINFNLKKPIILYVAALTKSKRQHLAIEAVRKLEKGSLLLVGKGDDEKKLKNLGGVLLKDRFKIKSFQYSDMPKVYKSVDVFVYPTSPEESFGISIVEAMAAGLPVVANNDPIRREIVGDAGLFADSTDTVALARSLGKAMQFNWYEKSLIQAKKYDWELIAEKYESLFNLLLK